ncbi:hypothetical protein K1719_014269 [Acacia pycnantha]|nr:hypothetical protein K1719_044242 [Acacia pycnantha]KAI9114571.1 hypothetical protein K1719_014269 [Acacia pycnantha]
MDAGCLSSLANLKTQSRCPLKEQFIQRKNSRENLDRFIPNRSAMDFDFAHYMLTEGAKGKENLNANSPSAYKKLLAEALNMNRTRILAFKNKPPETVELKPREFTTTLHDKSAKPRRVPRGHWMLQTLWMTTTSIYLIGECNFGTLLQIDRIVNNDVRIGSHIVETYRGHEQEVCGLTWSASGQQLASGGNDNLLFIWDRALSSSNSATQWLHRLEEHTSAVCALLWNKNEKDLLSSNGFTQNQLTLWKYPSMVKLTELNGHTSRVLHLGQSPDGCIAVSAAADETLRFWNVFGALEATKPAPKARSESFSNVNRIR